MRNRLEGRSSVRGGSNREGMERRGRGKGRGTKVGEGKAKEWSDKGIGRKGRHQDGENTHNEEALMRKQAKGEREKKRSAKEESKGKDERREKRAINPKKKKRR